MAGNGWCWFKDKVVPQLVVSFIIAFAIGAATLTAVAKDTKENTEALAVLSAAIPERRLGALEESNKDLKKEVRKASDAALRVETKTDSMQKQLDQIVGILTK